MTASYVLQLININQAAITFAIRGYHVTTHFSASNNGMSVAIYFHQIDEKEAIESILQIYKQEDDKLEFDEFTREDHSKFYTLTLTKYPLEGVHYE